MSKKNTYMGQEILFQTAIFGKPYFWMKDGDGVIYLTKAKETTESYSMGPDGKIVPLQRLVPDFS